MKAVIFHDFFGSIGGGEKLVLDLARYIGADIITTVLTKENISKMDTFDVKIISLGEPISFPVLKQIHATIKFARANFPDYDCYFFSGNWAPFAAKKHKPNIYYCHTPERMFYDLYKDFKNMVPWPLRPLFALWVRIHKYFLEKRLPYVEKIVTNSENCRKRINKYYKRDSTVVNPPVKQYKYRKNGDFWLSVNRIYPHKRIDLQLDVFRRLPNERLLIVGGVTFGDHANSYMRTMLKICPENVKFVGYVTEKKLEELYSDCKGFIATSVNEDFGMAPVEAMSAGKPVVAVNIGGFRESMINKKTGFLVEPTVDELLKAVRKISKNPVNYRVACENRAKDFSVQVFVDKIKKQFDN